ncbi:hypothetical protein [Hymenobacter lucidus]|uniref:Uncharacterized protein n=1 Tax=Hymenobacter lucidus TaxID=2880930 RepID=A0ABS8ANN1_9BACT|nr:hypothetical protein [Hymenobacter lucidus]MCB2407623.1 hypothetical protein [Hymenobacter lucidus]
MLLSTAAPLVATAGGVVVQQVTAAEYQQARKAARPGRTVVTFPVRKQGRRLSIPTSTGPVVLQDMIVGEAEVNQGHSEGETTIYTYHGYLSHFKRHLVEAAYYETTQWLLIGPDGRRLTLWGKPLYAPDQNRLVSICQGLEYSGGQPNIVQLFQLKNGVLQSTWELRPTAWEPEEIFWASPTLLYLKRANYSATGQELPASRRYSYCKLLIE